MNLKSLSVAAISSFFLFSCVSTKKYKEEQAKYERLNTAYTGIQGNLQTCLEEKVDLERRRALMQGEVDNLKEQVAFLKDNNNQRSEERRVGKECRSRRAPDQGKTK